jgi:hypothetical protein
MAGQGDQLDELRLAEFGNRLGILRVGESPRSQQSSRDLDEQSIGTWLGRCKAVAAVRPSGNCSMRRQSLREAPHDCLDQPVAAAPALTTCRSGGTVWL